jgi:hypothetical protein
MVDVYFWRGNEMLSSYAHDIGAFIGGLIAGALGGSLLTLRVTGKNRAAGNSNLVDQSKARAGGDIVGRNKTTTGGR